MDLTIILILVTIIIFLYFTTRKPFNYPPGPARLPLVGTLWRSLFEFRKTVMERHLHMHRKYGKILGYYVFNHPSVLVADYELAKEAFNKTETTGRPHLEYTKIRTHGKLRGVLLNDGPTWSAQRRFSLQHLRDLGMGRASMEDVIQHQVTDLLRRLHELDPLNAEQVNGFFNVHVLNVLWEIVTGRQFAHDDPAIQVILRSLQLFLRNTSGLLAVMKTFLGAVWRPLGGDLYESVRRARDDLEKLFRREIEQHRATLDPSSPRDFLDHLLIRSDEEGDKSHMFDEWELYALLQDLFLAGSETTSTTTEWGMLYMLRNMEAQRKVQAEMDKVVGPGQRVELRHRSQLPYMEAVLAEILRRSTVLPLAVPHRTLQELRLGGYTIPKNTWLNTNIYAIHNDEDYWGDPSVFRPERFYSDGKFVPDKHLMPFGIGKRVCMGESLARQESFLFFANILHNFNILPPDGRGPPGETPQTGLVTAPRIFHARFVPRH